MSNFLYKINSAQLALVVSASAVAEWMVSNNVVFWLTSFTIVLGALLQLRKFAIAVRRDVTHVILKIKSRKRDDPD